MYELKQEIGVPMLENCLMCYSSKEEAIFIYGGKNSAMTGVVESRLYMVKLDELKSS